MSKILSRLKFDALLPEELKARKVTGSLYIILEDFSYQSDLAGRTFTVPAGYETDFASIPPAARFYLDDDDPRILAGAVVHDYLYTNCGQLLDGYVYSREFADNILEEMMILCGARWTMAAVVRRSVRVGGYFHWNKN